MSVSAAKSRVLQAQTLIETRRYDEVEQVVETGLGFLVGLPAEETAVIAAELAALRVTAAEAATLEQYSVMVRAASREVRYAREAIEAGNIMPAGIEDRLRKAEVEYLGNVPDAAKTDLVAEIAALRGRLGGSVEAAAIQAEKDAVRPTPATPTDDEARIMSRARGEIMGCRSAIESRRTEGVAEALDEIAGKLATVTDVLVASMLAEIDVLRAELGGVESAEDIRRITSELDRHFSQAENGQAWRADDSARALAYLTDRLADEDVRRILPADVMRRYQDRMITAAAGRADVIKTDSLERALPPLTEIEERLATDPYAGVSQETGYAITSELLNLKERVVRALDPLPTDDADVISIHARLRAAEDQMDVASAALAKAALEAQVTEHWQIVLREFADWEQENITPPTQPGEVPDLPQTRLAIMRTGYWLHERETQQTRTENADNPTIQAVYRAAEETFDAAAAKLHAAYNRVIDDAADLPSPAIEADVSRLSHLATAAQTSFEETPYREPVLARIRELEERWKAEYAALLKARQELYDKLAVEADAAWPGIVAATGATEDFNPGDPDATGTTVLLSGVYNRSGWDFNGGDFCMRRNGVPIGGTYESHVLKALEHAWYELKLDVNDRITWDVIGVVTGPGKLGERTNRIVRDSSGLEIGKIEEWPPVDAVWLRIIALHAGPVGVGPEE